MINIKFPTDNLYKFMAVFGLIITLFSMGAMTYLQNETTKIILSKLKILHLMERNFDDISDIYNQLNKNGHIKKEALVENKKIIDSLYGDYSGLKNQNEIYNVVVKELQFNEQEANKGMWVGFIIMVWGFLHWYFRVQIYHDRILKAKTEVLTKQSKEAVSVNPISEVQTEQG